MIHISKMKIRCVAGAKLELEKLRRQSRVLMNSDNIVCGSNYSIKTLLSLDVRRSKIIRQRRRINFIIRKTFVQKLSWDERQAIENVFITHSSGILLFRKCSLNKKITVPRDISLRKDEKCFRGSHDTSESCKLWRQIGGDFVGH